MIYLQLMLLSSSNRKYQSYTLFVIFSVVVCLRCLLHHFLSLIAYTFGENRVFVFIIIVQLMMSANSRMRFCLQIVFVCLYIIPSHYHHCVNLSQDIKTINCLSELFYRVCEIKHILSVIHYTIYGCVFSLPISLVMIERIYLLCLITIIKSKGSTIIHCLGLGHETMVCAVYLYFIITRNINGSKSKRFAGTLKCRWSCLYINKHSQILA